MSIYKEPPPGMFVVPDPHDMTKVSEYPELIQLPPSVYLVLLATLRFSLYKACLYHVGRGVGKSLLVHPQKVVKE